jgi:hypothetical protein
MLELPIDMQIDLFNKIVKPVLLYGCEIWGFGNIDCIERVQLKFFLTYSRFKVKYTKFEPQGAQSS